jgi:phosphate transport system permease protein
VALASPPPRYVVEAAMSSLALRGASRLLATIVSLSTALAGFAFALWRIGPNLRARNIVERMIRLGLVAASTVAIVTTIGIIFSMLFETLHFFGLVPATDFFFGLVWDPRFSAPGRAGSEGQFGIIPLLWGTLYISFVALMVAVPVGLFAAVYMAEYASQRLRTASKPLLEVLSGIPTIVYGFFALISFGPFLRDVGAQLGLSISASSVLSAGVIMGVMLIPFVSSLSDDIINAVPQSLRDGSYALGATKSETIKRVILPAALPGIVGATLLAASRAIGETMIVVLAAGIAANLTLNPFDAVTTITVKIVSQLTGDLQFNSPQTLVAFALGLTLFAFTLVLNIYALYMVRRYHEQYE